jgi:ferritin-like metal-binding protein YciE
MANFGPWNWPGYPPEHEAKLVQYLNEAYGKEKELEAHIGMTTRAAYKRRLQQHLREAEEIAAYTAIEAFAESVSDRETARLARAIRRDEERMAGYLERLIPQLTRAADRADAASRGMRPTSGGQSPT